MGTEGIDRISAMADDILCKILSYIPTKDVVATSVLSKRWKNLSPFEMLPITIELDDSKSKSFSPESFIYFVDKLLNQTLRDVPCVEKILFRFGRSYNHDKIYSWICAAVQLNVVHLSFVSESYVSSDALFHGLNGCKTLVELEIGGIILLSVPDGFFLPNLKRLLLKELNLYDKMHSTNNLLSGCPLLEDLSLNLCKFGSMETLLIGTPLLKKFSIKNCAFGYRFELQIDAPNLEDLVYDGYCAPKKVVANFQSIHSVYLSFHYYPYNDVKRHLPKLIKACSSTNRLALFDDSLFLFHKFLRILKLPTFKNLTCLAIGLMEDGGCGDNGFLTCLLNSAPILHTLKIFEGVKNGSGRPASFELSLPISPICLKQCFKKFELWEFKGKEDEIKLIEYFLKNGSVLQEVIVHHYPCVDTSILNSLLMFPKYSRTCQILFNGEDGMASATNYKEKWLTGHM